MFIFKVSASISDLWKCWLFTHKIYAYFKAKSCIWRTIIFMMYILKSWTQFFRSRYLVCSRITKTSQLAQDLAFRKAFYPLKTEIMWKCVHHYFIMLHFTEAGLYEFFPCHFSIRISGSAKIKTFSFSSRCYVPLTCPFFWIFLSLFSLLTQVVVPSCSR